MSGRRYKSKSSRSYREKIPPLPLPKMLQEPSPTLREKSRRKIRPIPHIDQIVDPRTKTVFRRKGYEVLPVCFGTGTFGQVFKVLIIPTRQLAAVKVIDLTKCTEKYRQKFLPRELAVMMEIRHENIIRVYDMFRSNKRIYIFMEYAANSDLGKYIKSRKQELSEDEARPWFTQAANALNYLHEEMFVAHRDVKIENILLSASWVAKLTDFGFVTDALLRLDGGIDLSRTLCGTLPYYSPQLVSRRPYNAFKTDIWALGVVLFAMTYNRFPFHYRDLKKMYHEQTHKKYIRARLKDDHSIELRDLIEKTLEPDEDERLSSVQVLKHDWVRKPSYMMEPSPQPMMMMMTNAATTTSTSPAIANITTLTNYPEDYQSQQPQQQATASFGADEEEEDDDDDHQNQPLTLSLEFR